MKTLCESPLQAVVLSPILFSLFVMYGLVTCELPWMRIHTHATFLLPNTTATLPALMSIMSFLLDTMPIQPSQKLVDM